MISPFFPLFLKKKKGSILSIFITVLVNVLWWKGLTLIFWVPKFFTCRETPVNMLTLFSVLV